MAKHVGDFKGYRDLGMAVSNQLDEDRVFVDFVTKEMARVIKITIFFYDHGEFVFSTKPKMIPKDEAERLMLCLFSNIDPIRIVDSEENSIHWFGVMKRILMMNFREYPSNKKSK